MKHWTMVVRTVAVLGFLTSCGQTKLDEAQQAKLKELVTSTKSVISSVQGKQGTRSVRFAADPKDNRFNEKFASAQCSDVTPKSTEKPGISGVNLKLAGDKCPLEFDMAITGSKESVTVRFHFAIKDQELAALSDVSSYDMSGTLATTGGTLKGAIVSKKFGKVEITLTMTSPDGKSGKLETSYKFSDFEARLRIEGTSEKKTYFIGSDEVKQEKYVEVAGGTLPGLGN